MPIEPPDPLITQDLLDLISQPGTQPKDGRVVTAAGRDLYLGLSNGRWILGSVRVGAYDLSAESFQTLVGAKDPQRDGEYTAANGTRYSLHPVERAGARWAEHRLAK